MSTIDRGNAPKTAATKAIRLAQYRAVVEAMRHDRIAAFALEVAEWIAYQILFKTQITITHSMDPSWDDSGMGIRTDKPYDPSQYDSLYSFLGCYTGNSEPTFESGHGLRWSTFGDELLDMAHDAAREWLTDALAALRKQDPAAVAFLVELACEEDEMFDSVCGSQDPALEKCLLIVLCNARERDVAEAFNELPLAVVLQDAVTCLDLAALLESGRAEAQERRRTELEEKDRQQIRLAALREQVAAAEAELAEAYPPFGHRRDQRPQESIGKNGAEWKRIRKVLSTWPPEKLKLLARTGRFSNSITGLLADGTVHEGRRP